MREAFPSLFLRAAAGEKKMGAGFVDGPHEPAPAGL